MIIQCDHCSAKFRMDDSKLANGSVKVRCAKCKQVFVVQKEVSTAESALPLQPENVPPAGNAMPPERVSAPSAESSAETTAFSFDTPAGAEDAFSQVAADFSFDDESPSVNKTAAQADDDLSNEFDWQGTSSPAAATATDSDFDMAAFDVSISSPQAATATAPPAYDDNDFSFDDSDHKVENAVTAGGQQAADFSMDFGEISFSDQPAVPSDAFAAPSGMSTQAADSSAADDFLLSFNSDSSQQSPSAFAGGDEPGKVNFGEFSFGETDDAVVTETGKPSATPPVEAPAQFVSAGAADQYPDEELPPLSLTSRKKSGSLFPILVIFGAIVLIVALAGSGVYFFGGPKAFSKVGLGFLVEWYGDKGGDDGSIVLKGVTAAYTVNSSAGELFVVRGEAANNFKKPRASIQIKVSLLGTGGSVLVTKSAYCGNSLSNDQLTTLPLAKIEEIMNNQFGDSLANLGLKPGGTIPFVVVVSPVPKESTDYNVQVGGSTVATQ